MSFTPCLDLGTTSVEGDPAWAGQGQAGPQDQQQDHLEGEGQGGLQGWEEQEEDQEEEADPDNHDQHHHHQEQHGHQLLLEQQQQDPGHVALQWLGQEVGFGPCPVLSLHLGAEDRFVAGATDSMVGGKMCEGWDNDEGEAYLGLRASVHVAGVPKGFWYHSGG